MERADVVIIGGGAVGAATAFRLAKLGMTDIVLLERDTLASGSTSKSAGGVRFQFDDELNVRIMMRSLPEFEHFEAMIGEHCDYVPDIGLQQVGYLFLLTQPHDVEVFERSVALQQSLEVDTRFISTGEVSELVPGMVVDDLLAATFNPREGFCSPEAVVFGYAAAARALGARVHQGRAVTGIETVSGRVERVNTTKGPIATEMVICAAGAWSREIGDMVGANIPVHGMTRHMWFSPESGGLPDRMPLTIDFATSFYLHREGQGVVFGGKYDTLEEVALSAVERVPAIGEIPIARTWSGFYEVSPDHNALVGPVPGVAGFLVATGFSGHGFQQAPAVGEHLAQLACGVTPSLDLSAFALDRFERGKRRTEHFVI